MTIISTPVLNDTFTSNGEFHKIEQTGFAFSVDATPALNSLGFTDLTLDNYGSIINSGGGNGLLVHAREHRLDNYNESTGHIEGVNGVVLMGADVVLTNYGTINSYGTGEGAVDEAIGLSQQSRASEIYNYGDVAAKRIGIGDDSDQGSDLILNKGTVEGGVYGIELSLEGGRALNVVNYGTIKGGVDSIITGDSGLLHLRNYGSVIGNLKLTSADPLDRDEVHNFGTIAGSVRFGNGDDWFDGGNGSTGAVFGEAGNDRLNGGTHADRLNGGIGNDLLAGSRGNDTLTGGNGKDTFLFNTAFNSAGVDRITDFTHGIDHIRLESAIFKGMPAKGVLPLAEFHEGPSAHDANDRVIYNPANGWLIYDSNGNAAGGAHHFATLAAHLQLSHADFLMTP